MDARPTPLAPFENLLRRFEDRTANIGVIGLGYVGLPLAAAMANAGFSVLGFDVDDAKPLELMAGRSYIPGVSSADLRRFIDAGQFDATSDFDRLPDCDAIIICVPTPLTLHREPDLSYV